MEKNHKWKYHINVKKKILVLIILGVFLFVGIGFGILESNLGIGGTVEVSKFDRTLVGAMKREVNKGYATKYTGNHQDSMDPTKSTEDIYRFYTNTDDKGNEVLNKNNVVFADKCWQMIRTTDTGGVRLLYNGEPETTVVDGVTQYNCGDTRNYYHLGGILSEYDLSGNKKYAKNYTATTSGTTTTFTLVDDSNDPDDTYTVNIDSSNADTEIAYIVANYPYTCGNTTGTCTNANFRQVVSQSSGTTANIYKSTQRDNIGLSGYNNNNSKLPAYVGYKYGDTYTTGDFGTKGGLTGGIEQFYDSGIPHYWAQHESLFYGDNIEYSPSGCLAASGGCYRIRNYRTYYFSSTDEQNVVGKYMIQYGYTGGTNAVETYSDLVAYYILGVYSHNLFYTVELRNGSIPSNLNGIYVADSINQNGELVNPTFIKFTDVLDANGMPVDMYMTNKYACADGGLVCSNPRYILTFSTTTSRAYYTYIDLSAQITLAKDVNGLNLVDYTTITMADWIDTYYNNNEYKYTCGNADTVCTDSNFKFMYYKEPYQFWYTKNYYFGSSVKYENGKYKLQNAIQLNSNSLASLSNHHYTCLDRGETECSSVAYVYYTPSSGGVMSYFIMNDPDILSVQDALDAMLKKNTTDSTVKTYIDKWYEDNLLNTTYESKLDDTIYCNDRTIDATTYPDSGWNDDGGSVFNYLYFKESSASNDLSCTNVEDQFSVSNNQAQLTYKIGLLSQPELRIMGNINSKTNLANYWLSSANRFDAAAYVRRLTPDGGLGSGHVSTASAVRPAISLIAGTKYSRGTGKMTDPYIVDMSE